MLGVQWDDLTVAAAFTLGAVLATIACLRVVRAVTNVFDSAAPRRLPRDRPPDDPPAE